ncbi:MULTISPECIES: hypothetical protein [unclassified Mesobacillus]|uniref:hypothetical protein n=1 Tax=unclassified Mesobacillus TaxID=2675270 RepID=UPI00203FF181|nr:MULTISPECIES: hypothetical protein [unclassified Mesobacillus]MCM3123823.1 hypothetical protein [Mesobacillus sp. MER 33]MCM3234162.1 hypothetical protein [Mesobacillus sp. MER 48]
MENRIEVFRGLFNYNYYTYKLRDNEGFPGVWKKTILFILLSGLIFGFSAYFGIDSEYLSRKLTSIPRAEYEMNKFLFLAGQIIQGLFFGAIMLFLPALFFWTVTDLEFKRLLTIQLFVMPIFLLEKLLIVPMALYLGLTKISSPFSLGVIAQYITGNDFVIHFLAYISIFKIWAIFIEYKYLKAMTDKNPKIILLFVTVIHLVIWLFAALISFVRMENIL